ncbi:MAG: helix-turn-helix domain-containing protein [Actinomycetota bacterium]|nr:helix-turn-helix domain-containing protein [Actinomycetota bacterium]
MNPEQAKAFGRYLRDIRVAAGLSLRQLDAATGIHNSLLVRMEQGAIANPTPEKLQRIAAALDVSLADLYARADYLIPNDLPGLGAYLRLKYREYSAEVLDALESEIQATIARHDLAPVPIPVENANARPKTEPERR